MGLTILSSVCVVLVLLVLVATTLDLSLQPEGNNHG